MISQNFSGHLVAHTDWPTPLKNKGVYFVKREREPLPKTNFLTFLTCGDIHPNALDHFCAWVEEVCNFQMSRKETLWSDIFDSSLLILGGGANLEERKKPDQVSAMCGRRHQEAGARALHLGLPNQGVHQRQNSFAISSSKDNDVLHTPE